MDNDDGTAYYNTSRNLMMYGGAGMKSDCTSKHRALFDAPNPALITATPQQSAATTMCTTTTSSAS